MPTPPNGSSPDAGPGGTRLDGVIVVGGGYAGVTAAQSAAALGVAATVVDPTEYHDMTTRLAAVAGGTAPADDARIPLAELVEQSIVGRVVSVDDGAVRLDDGRSFSADAVVLTAGSTPMRPPIDGIEYAPSLRSANDSLSLRTAIAETSDRLIIVGGGPTGVQLAGAAASAHRDLDITVVDGESRLLGSMPEPVSERATQILRDRGVEVVLDSPVAQIFEHGVDLPGGGHRDGTVVFTGGFEADAGHFGATVTAEGRIAVGRDLRVTGAERTFAAGDIAAHTTRDGEPLEMSAQIAVQAGHQAGSNAARAVLGQALTEAKLSHRGWVMDLGGWQGVATLGPVALAAPLLDRIPPLLHYLIDMTHLVDVLGRRAWSYRPG